MDHIVSEYGRRRDDDSAAGLQRLDDLAQQLLLIEDVLDQGQHEDGVELGPKIEGVLVEVPGIELYVSISRAISNASHPIYRGLAHFLSQIDFWCEKDLVALNIVSSIPSSRAAFCKPL